MNGTRRKVRVLVAEDNEDHLFLMVHALRGVEGVSIEVEAVADGAQALDYVYGRGAYTDRTLPNLIFLDLRMPKVDGLEVLEQLKQDERFAPIPVVMLTSSDRPEDIDEAYRRGTNSYVAKPSGGQGLRDITNYWTSESLLPDPPDA